MMEKNHIKETAAPDQESSRLDKSQNDNTLPAQRANIIEGLRVFPEGLTTIQLRELLDVMSAAPRVFELRHDHGYNIHTEWVWDTNAQGNRHRCGKYILLPGKWQGAA